MYNANYISPEQWKSSYPDLDWALDCLEDNINPYDLFPIYPFSKGMLKIGYNFIGGWKTPEDIWAVCKVKDYSNSLNIKTRKHILIDGVQSHTYSLYSWMYAVPHKLLSNTLTAIFPYRKVEDCYFVEETKDGQLCSGSTLTLKELALLKITLSDYVPKWQEIVKNGIKSYFEEYSNVVPHIEKPVKFYLQGVDDSSYTALFKDLRSALEALKEFTTTSMTYKDLTRFNFVFTN